MINISTYYGLKIKQNALAFVDVKLDDDNELFIDPRLIETTVDPLVDEMRAILNFYSPLLIKSLIRKNKVSTYALMEGLSEPSETRLGYGTGSSDGNSIGRILKEVVFNELTKNIVISSGRANKLSDLELIVKNVSCDRISDWTTKIIKYSLIAFTQKQCLALRIPMKAFPQKDIFDVKTSQWVSQIANLPFECINGTEKAIIFVPKSIVRRSNDASANMSCFFSYAVRQFVRDDLELTKDIAKNGKNDTMLQKDIQEVFPKQKDTFNVWILRFKNLFNDYKSYVHREKLRSLTDEEIEAIVYSDKVSKAA